MTDRITEDRISTNGIQLNVLRAGPTTGRLVVLLHGFPECARLSWRRQITALAEAGYRVLAPDQRGYNLSDKPKGVAAYALDTLARDIVGLIEAEGCEKALVVGHDWGAAVAWWLGARYAERVEKLAILNVPHASVMRRNLVTNPAQRRKSWYIFAFQLPVLPEWMMGRDDWSYAARGLVRSSRPGTFSEEDLAGYRRAWSQPGAMTAMINWYRAALRHPPRRKKGQSSRVRVPTLVIWGARDKFLGRELAQPSIEMCDHGRLVFLEEASHWVQHEEPVKVNALLLEHFADQTKP